jgi:hypothetical protein
VGGNYTKSVYNQLVEIKGVSELLLMDVTVHIRSQQLAKIHENRLRRWDFCSLAQFITWSARQARRPT